MLPFLIGETLGKTIGGVAKIAAAGAIGVAGGIAVAKAMKANSNVFYTTKDASSLLDISEYTVRKKIRDGELKAEVIPGKSGYRIKKEDLAEYVANKGRPRMMPVPEGRTVDVFGEDSGATQNRKIFGDSMLQLNDAVKNNPEIKNVNTDLLRSIIAGKETDLKGLWLRLKRLELDDDDSIEFKKKKLQLEIDINDLEAEIQAYKVVGEMAVEKTKSNPVD